MVITARELMDFMGETQLAGDTAHEAFLNKHIMLAESAVAAYCRQRHLFPNQNPRPGVKECVMSLAARTAANPSMLNVTSATGQESDSIGTGGMLGLSLLERQILHRYRKQAMR